MDARCWIITGPDSSQNFALEMASSMQESPTVSQPTSESWIFTSMRRLQPSTWPKRHVPIPYPPASLSYTMLICLNDLFACSGLTQTCKLLTNFSKNSFYLLPEPLRRGEFLTNYCLLLREVKSLCKVRELKHNRQILSSQILSTSQLKEHNKL